MSTLLVKISNLSVTIDEKDILKDVSFEIAQGKIITIIGPNGSGKTTIARCLLKLIEPNSGNLWFKSGLKIGYMPQKVTINPSLPMAVTDFLHLKVKYEINKKLLQEAIEETGIERLLSFPLQKLSGGELQRVLLARTLLRKPGLLILDEPVQGIDINGQVEFYKLIDQLRLKKISAF
jgi:zinc transport system ATP-binding protein